MLGWLHQALASERELVHTQLDPDAVVDTGSTVNRFSKSLENGTGKTESDLTFVLDRIFEGVCRPFKVRVEQVLQSQPSLIIAWRLKWHQEDDKLAPANVYFLKKKMKQDNKQNNAIVRCKNTSFLCLGGGGGCSFFLGGGGDDRDSDEGGDNSDGGGGGGGGDINGADERPFSGCDSTRSE
ncbi:hypothetical protein OIU84_022869 [Salix udensis]|uniref:Conserved Oligomeric Golgi complex subunit 6 C-terminal domain-containing protein n=1 Tax=Salix udensis TaxID=889485 RepID=A0AAD6PFQ8_9ROSI|nr:hypothetical protein OIU84_022869 [Salix udensis]